jgi:hypothetical protein
MQEGETSEKVLELNVQIASAFCAAAEIYLTDAWYVAEEPFQSSIGGPPQSVIV